MPGPGGSMGQCCFCGKPFMAEILGIGKVQIVEIDAAPDQRFHAHKKCVEAYGNSKFEDLPEESPLKAAWKRAQPISVP